MWDFCCNNMPFSVLTRKKTSNATEFDGSVMPKCAELSARTGTLLDEGISGSAVELISRGQLCRSMPVTAWGSLPFVRFPDSGLSGAFIFMQLLCLKHVTHLACLYFFPQHIKGVDCVTGIKNYTGLQFHLCLKIFVSKIKIKKNK